MTARASSCSSFYRAPASGVMRLKIASHLARGGRGAAAFLGSLQRRRSACRTTRSSRLPTARRARWWRPASLCSARARRLVGAAALVDPAVPRSPHRGGHRETYLSHDGTSPESASPLNVDARWPAACLAEARISANGRLPRINSIQWISTQAHLSPPGRLTAKVLGWDIHVSSIIGGGTFLSHSSSHPMTLTKHRAHQFNDLSSS